MLPKSNIKEVQKRHLENNNKIAQSKSRFMEEIFV